MWGCEPLQGKGGNLIPIHKGGVTDDVRSYRGILLLNNASKLYHARLRLKLLQWVQPHKPIGQIGGFPHQQVVFGVHTLTTLTHIFTKNHYSFLALFIDVQSAFHHLVRELVMGIRDKEHLEIALEQLTVQEALGVDKWLQLPSILEQFGVPSQLLRIVQDVHANTWFRVPTVDALVKTHRGSRPGSPIADMIWHILMLRLHEEGEQALSRHPQVVQAFANFGIPITAVTWADDIVVPIATEHAVELLPCTTVILQDILSAVSILSVARPQLFPHFVETMLRNCDKSICFRRILPSKSKVIPMPALNCLLRVLIGTWERFMYRRQLQITRSTQGLALQQQLSKN